MGTLNVMERGRFARHGVLAAVLGGTAGCYSGVGVDMADTHSGVADDGEGEGEGEDGESGGADDGEDAPEGFEPAPGAMFRLTVAQYENSIRDVFGPDITLGVELDVDESAETYKSIGASKVGTSVAGVEAYRAGAFDIAQQVFANPSAQPWLQGCTATSSGDTCVRNALATVGRRLWRRPMTQDELDRYASLVDAPHEGGHEPQIGFEYAIAALIESPYFIYVPMVGEPAGESKRYTSYEMASRLSLLLWNSGPDDALLDAAQQDSLVSADGVESQVRRMLSDERSTDLLTRFFSEAWNVDKLDLVSKNPEAFPDWSQDIVEDYRTEFRLVLEQMMTEGADARSLFSRTTTFANPELAALYGLEPGDPSDAMDGFAEVDLGDRRHGLLTSGAVLAANSPSDRSSPTIRGKFVLERLLCGFVPPPPPDVDDTLPEGDGEPKTTRQMLEEHAQNPSCAGCHQLMDPLGVTFENYDGVGVWRDTENGFDIDASGEYIDQSFKGAGDLANYLANDPRFAECISSQVLSFAAGREIRPEDDEMLSRIATSFEDSEYQLQELVVGVVTSAAFRYVGEETGA